MVSIFVQVRLSVNIICDTLLYDVETLLKLLSIFLIFRQVEADLTKAHDDEEVENLLKRQRQLGQRVCVRCGQGFSLLFNRRLECGDCGLGVCRKCSSWVQDPIPSWRCVGCQGEK